MRPLVYRGFTPEMRPKFVAGVAAREFGQGNGHVEKAADRLPSVRRAEDQQPLGRDCRANFLIVAPVGCDQAVFIKPTEDTFHQKLVIVSKIAATGGGKGRLSRCIKNFPIVPE